MTRSTQVEKIQLILSESPGRRYSAKEIASELLATYPSHYKKKRENPRFATDKDFIFQLSAEIGAQKEGLLKLNDKIMWQDKPSPRVYWLEQPSSSLNEDLYDCLLGDDKAATGELSEHNLYPILIDYLKSEHNLFCMRIDEKRSKNNYGSGGNQWLHPDIVAMEPIGLKWHSHVKTCVLNGGGQSVRLWSFEVKKHLTMGNIRKSFFQAVSNSTWANEGYLVATSIADSRVEQELRMLSALHGIGVILLSVDNPSESELLLPAAKRPNADWGSINRITVENADFHDFIDLVSNYYQTGNVRNKDWGN